MFPVVFAVLRRGPGPRPGTAETKSCFISGSGFGVAASLRQGNLGPEVAWANLKHGRTFFLKIKYTLSVV